MSKITIMGNKKHKGFELKIARLRAGLKQYELAAKVGIGPTQLCEIEAGRREPSPELLGQLVRILEQANARGSK